MDALDLLLQTEVPEPETKEYNVKRLSKLCGEPVIFKLRGLSYSRVAEIKKQHGDAGDMEVHIVLKGVTSPSLKDKGLMEKYAAASPAELIKKLLTPGEISELSRAVEKLSGYRTETISEVKKNSTEAESLA